MTVQVFIILACLLEFLCVGFDFDCKLLTAQFGSIKPQRTKVMLVLNSHTSADVLTKCNSDYFFMRRSILIVS